MKLRILLFVWTSLLLFSCSTKTSEQETKESDKFYSEEGITGTFILKNLETKEVLVYNPQRSDTLFVPASTFKVFNSLVCLQEKVVDEKTVIPWDSVVRTIENWNEDMWMTKAFPRSCVWYYQELARKVGEERMQYWLDTIAYGNQTMGAPIDLFWLEGELKISARQQILFLEKMYNQELPFDADVQSRVKNLMLNDSTDAYQIYAKTGWGMRVEEQIGWYVGFVETPEGKWVFANNINIHSLEDLRYRKDVLYQILRHENIIKE